MTPQEWAVAGIVAIVAVILIYDFDPWGWQ